MSDSQHPSPWPAAIATGTLALLLSAAGLWVTQEKIAADAAEQWNSLSETHKALEQRVVKLEALPAADPSGKAAIDAATQPLNDRIIALEAQLAASEARIETLEKAPTPPAPPAPEPQPHAQPAPPAAPIAAPAPPVTSEQERMAQFKAILATLPPPADDAGEAARSINQRFGGLITIRKSAPDTYAPLRNATTVAQARAAIATLPVTQQAPFAGWLATMDAGAH